MFRPSIVPKDSILHLWIDSLQITEVPVSYQVAVGLSALGCLLKRQVWCDQVKWQVYPNLSVLLVGPSGIGKDVAIREAQNLVNVFDESLDIGGKTMEVIQQQLIDAGDPACAFVAAPELTAFLGGKDYQKSMAQELTDLLTTGDKVNVSLKSTPGMKRIIKHPTVTMQAGSTEEWLHKAMPEGSLEGGLFPRFIIVCEEYGTKNIPLLKYSIDIGERNSSVEAGIKFRDLVYSILERYTRSCEITPLADAVEEYERWYINRFKQFSPTVRPYANRSRDQVLRMAMLMAITRGHNYMEAVDIKFAASMMNYVAKSIDKAAAPPSVEARIAKAILELLPAKTQVIMMKLGRKYGRKDINSALELLMATHQVQESRKDGSMIWSRREGVANEW